MTDREPSAPEATGSLEDLISAEVNRRSSAVKDSLRKGEPPSDQDVAEIVRLSKLKKLLPPDTRFRGRLDVIFFCIAGTLLLMSVFIRLGSTSVDLDIRATKIKLTLVGQRPDLLVPGELGEILSLREARVSGADNVLPPAAGSDGSVDLKQFVPQGGSGRSQRDADFAVRLQEISIPSDTPFTLTIGIAYAADASGLKFESSGVRPATVRFGEIIPIASPDADKPQKQYAISPVEASGKNLAIELFPLAAKRSLTVFRDVQVSEISFELDGHSSILSGAAIVRSRSESRIPLQASDRLVIGSSNKPMLVRELAFVNRELRATISATDATTIQLGDDHPRDLMPTLFDWVRSRWPTQLYGTLSALAAFWFAFRQWQTSSK